VKVDVRLFAVARDLAGTDLISLELPTGSTVSQLRAQLSTEVHALASVLPHILIAVGSEYVRDDAIIPAGTEVACIPPVSGG
jgi:molybdopterin converting factor subunit 1